MSLYEYLKKNLERRDPYPAIDHHVRAQFHLDGRISFYIHVEGRDSETADFWVSDAGIFEKVQPMSKQAEFLTYPKDMRDAKLAASASEDDTNFPGYADKLSASHAPLPMNWPKSLPDVHD
jgi:hypothetical protein